MHLVCSAAYVVMPSGKKAYPKIQDNKDGTVTVRYQPTEIGLHELYVKYNNDDIEGEKRKSIVGDPVVSLADLVVCLLCVGV